jgi:hypothetical protein
MRFQAIRPRRRFRPKGNMMSTSTELTLNANTVAAHQGVQRVENGLAAVRDAARGATSTKGLATALMGALVATLVVLADRVVDTWGDEHLFAAWVLMWALVFGALGLFSNVARRSATGLATQWRAWRARRAQAAADAHFWAVAQKDSRVMADLLTAQSLAQDQALAAAQSQETVRENSSAPTAAQRGGALPLSRAYI